MIGPQINMTSRAIASGKRIFEVLDTESAVKEKPNAMVLSNIKGDIKFNDVNFSYESAKTDKTSGNILEDINLEAKSGEMVALLGATGSGKTTLVNLIPRFYDVTAGSITIDDIDIRDVTLASLEGKSVSSSKMLSCLRGRSGIISLMVQLMPVKKILLMLLEQHTSTISS